MSKLDIHRVVEEEEQTAAVESEVKENQPVGEPDKPEGAEVEAPEEDQGEFELTIDDEQEPEPEPEVDAKAVLHKLSKQRKRAQSAEAERDELRKKLEQYESQGVAPAQPQAPEAPRFEYGSPAPVPPDRYQGDIVGDEAKYAQAHAQYMKDWYEWNNAQLQPQRQQEEQTNKLKEMHKRHAEALADDATKLIKEKKISEAKVVEAISNVSDKIDGVIGFDGAFNTLAANLVDGGGAKLAYFLNSPKNSAYLNQLTKIMEDDPSGLRAASYSTSLLYKMKGSAGRAVSKAPEPDEPIRGDGNAESARASDLQRQYDDETDFKKLREINQKAKELGVKLVIR